MYHIIVNIMLRLFHGSFYKHLLLANRKTNFGIRVTFQEREFTTKSYLNSTEHEISNARS